MPLIPGPTAPSVNPTGSSGQPYQNIGGVEPNAFGAGIGQATSTLGAQMERTAAMLERHAITLQNERDEALVNVAVTDAIRREGEITGAFHLLTGDAAHSAYPQYVKDLEAARQAAGATLPPHAKRAYDNQTMRQFGYQVVNGSRHAATELKKFSTRAREARIENEVGVAVRSLDDAQLEESLSEERLRELYTMPGSDARRDPPEEISRRVRQKQAEAYSARIVSTADSQPERALHQLDKWKDKLDPVQAEEVRKRVINQLITQRGRDISVQRTTEGGGTPFHQLLRSGVETGSTDPYNTTLDNGRWTGGPVKLTEMTIAEVRELQERMRTPENRALYGNGRGSSAVGAPQIVGSTLQSLIDKGVVKPDQLFDEKTQDEIITYLAKQRAGDVKGLQEEWEGLKGVSPETIQAAYAASFGDRAAIRPGDRTSIVESAKTDAIQQAKALGLREDETIRMVDQAASMTESRYNKKMAEIRDTQQGILNTLATAAMGEDPTGLKSPKTIDEMFEKQPELRSQWGAANRETQTRVLNILNRNSKADHPDSDEARERFYQLYGMAKSSNPASREEFMQIDPSQEEMPRRYRGQLLKMQANIKLQTEDDIKVTRRLGDIKSIIDPVIPSSNKNARAAFEGRFREQMADFKRTNSGKDPSEEDARKIAAALIAKVVTSPGMIWNSEERLFRIEQVPEPDKAAIKRQWKEIHGEDADDQTILKVWRTQQVRKSLKGK